MDYSHFEGTVSRCRSPFKSGSALASRLCKAAMLHRFKLVAKEAQRQDLLATSSYREAKVTQQLLEVKHVINYFGVSLQSCSFSNLTTSLYIQNGFCEDHQIFAIEKFSVRITVIDIISVVLLSLKRMAKPYQEAKNVLRAYLLQQGFGSWLVKLSVSDNFSM